MKIGERIFHEIELPFPKCHVDKWVCFICAADGCIPRHAVLRCGFLH
ncbi:hypothetical protein ACHAXM_005891 [Skeletonema potamos]